MKLTFKEQQPIRLWFEYLKVCLNDKDLSKRVNRNFYKDWQLDLVKKQKFNKWIRTHQHLFTKAFESKISLFNGKKTPNTLLVEIPLDYTVQKIQRDIGKVIKGRIAQKQTNQQFQITSNQKNLKIAPFDYFRYAWQIKRRKEIRNMKIKLNDIWFMVNYIIKRRQKKIKPWLLDYESIDKITGKTIIKKSFIRIRKLSENHTKTKSYNSKAVVMANNIRKAENILNNVCKGVFPGNYSISTISK
jgi:hypothetical protein